MITRIKWNEHKVLGGLELDFCNPDGKPCNTIVMAGENGTGKTSILQTLFDFLNLSSFTPFDYLEYEADRGRFRLTPVEDSSFGFHLRTDLDTNNPERIFTSRNNNPQKIESDLKDIRHYGCIYSTARSVFKTEPITASSTLALNTDPHKADDDKYNFKNIKQLLVDLETEDALDLKEKMDKDQGKLDRAYSEITKNYRISRFKNAFDSFFTDVKYDRIENVNNAKEIYFAKNGKRIPIDDLSTGEKQIVYRGAFCLKDRDSVSNGVVLIDEPELSMHPRWQSRILQFYRDIFTLDGVQSTQIIIATHSQYVVKEALNDQMNCKVIVLDNKNGTVISQQIPSIKLTRLLASEINYIAFGIISEDYFMELYENVQTKSGNGTISDCDNYILKMIPPQELLRNDSYNNYTYQTLPTFIRNAISHPNSNRTYTEDELKKCVEFLRSII